MLIVTYDPQLKGPASLGSEATISQADKIRRQYSPAQLI